MDIPRRASLRSVQIPGFIAESVWGSELSRHGDADCHFVLGDETHISSASDAVPSNFQLIGGHFAVTSLKEHLQQGVSQLVSSLGGSRSRGSSEDGVGTWSSQSDTVLVAQTGTSPPLSFASITSAAVNLRDRLHNRRTEDSHQVHRRSRRKTKKQVRCGHCTQSKGLSSPSSSENTCTCAAPISFVSTAVGQVEKKAVTRPSWEQLLAHPIAALAFVPKDTSLFVAGALAGATAKTITAPLDRLKLLLQVQDVNRKAGAAAVTLSGAVAKIFKEEGVLGFWKGNVPQVVRILPYSAVQLFSYEFFKKCFKGKRDELSVPGRLAAGACAGMTSTLITFPLDTLRFKMAVEPEMRTMSQAAVTLFRNEGLAGYYRGLGPALLGIAPYIAINFCAYDLVKKAFPEDQQRSPQVSFATAVIATSLATVTCYPLDTIRRQMQVRGCQYTSLFDAFPAIIAKSGVLGLYRGFFINALKNLPTSSIRLTTYQSAKEAIAKSHEEWNRLVAEGQKS
ncbi:hypothetical protein KFL_005330060 [Klebsormidium nitens]|uniref:Mitochondrial substrate carrier family protein n=1 Tax=Klebsormidium nitens TaxID=105231 RepID=A0A1Y1IK57_KLENI|nr:hypothetical protein KFL_005330060 [Klebsormidium nitens]|eukprot:GAQ89531.1 hypothetical protein KFL_005330060 [Klebsormidium nitens]